MRNGALYASDNGILQTQNGVAVSGENGPISIPNAGGGDWRRRHGAARSTTPSAAGPGRASSDKSRR